MAKGRLALPNNQEEMVVITVLPIEAPREGAAALKMAVLLQSLTHSRVRGKVCQLNSHLTASPFPHLLPKIHRVVGVAPALERTLLLTEFTLDGTLQQKLVKDGNKVNEQDRLTYCRDIADAMAYVQSRSMAHGDLRAAMIVVVNGVCKLTDFGYSRSISAREANLALRWTAPELSAADRPSILGDIFRSVSATFS